MIKYKKAVDRNKLSDGTDFSKVKKQVVPNQAMTVREIMNRFTRNEPLAIAKEKFYHDGSFDLEKIAHADMVDRGEFIEIQNRIQKRFAAQEEYRKKQEEEKQVLEKANALAAEKAANAANGGAAK